jgi:hypothetical protein
MLQAELTRLSYDDFAEGDLHWSSAFNPAQTGNHVRSPHHDGCRRSQHPLQAHRRGAHKACQTALGKKLAAIAKKPGAAAARQVRAGRCWSVVNHLGPRDHIITIDPGKTNIMLLAVEGSHDGTLRVNKLTRAQFTTRQVGHEGSHRSEHRVEQRAGRAPAARSDRHPIRQDDRPGGSGTRSQLRWHRD